ncbi:MAG TPA: TonB-dependent receptor [Bryobacteraceae bacterium]|nr:TonB-dependent receptor [Bryobacteraceae bacterium]
MRFGMRIRDSGITDVNPANFGGTFSFFGVTGAPALDANNQPIPGETTNISSLEQYRRTLIGAPGGGASQFSLNAGNPIAKINLADIGLYATDDWRVLPNFTISMGLRYEAETHVHDLTDFGPRIALAWSPKTKNGATPKIVIRAGAGLMYQRPGTGFFLQAAHFNGINQQQFIINDPTFFPSAPPLASLEAGQQPITTWHFDAGAHVPTGLASVLTLERQLPAKTTVSANWVHFHGTHFITTLNVNTPLPGTYNPADPLSGVRPYGSAAGNIFDYEPVGIVNQDQMWVEVNSKPNSRVSITASYQASWSSDDFTQGPVSNPYDIRQDYGRSPWNRRNNFTLLGTITGPYKIQWSPFLIAASGAPYDLTIGTDLSMGRPSRMRARRSLPISHARAWSSRASAHSIPIRCPARRSCRAIT